MINRRHIRIKVLQSAYALLLAESDNLDIQERYLLKSIDRLHDLYLLYFKLFIALFKKANQINKAAKVNFIQSVDAVINSPNFSKNKVMLQIEEAILLQDYPENTSDVNWEDNAELIEIIWKLIQKNKAFKEYMSLKNPTYKDDQQILITLFKKIIAPNDQLADFFEGETISWVDDIPFVNTWILENLKGIRQAKKFTPDRLYKEKEDRQFSLNLFRKTVLNYSKYEKDIDKTTPNWDTERITKIDKLLIVMGIAEFHHFPSIPAKVSINEYIEISKDYATPKSSYFINGVLDKLLLDYKKNKTIQKIGRGLL